jgi:hypothetical protein
MRGRSNATAIDTETTVNEVIRMYPLDAVVVVGERNS